MWHTPEAINGIPDLEQHYNAVDIQVGKIKQEIYRIDEDNYFENMSEGRVVRWESILNLTPSITDTLEERRFAVQSAVVDTLPYTYKVLVRELKALAGESTTFNRYFDENGVMADISVGVGSSSMVQAIDDLLDRKLPLDVVYFISIRYTPYYYLTQYTHNDLAQYTHEQIRGLMD